MKITLAPVGSLGDIRPMIALGKRLRDRGDAIVFCAPSNFRDIISSNGFHYHPMGIDIQTILQANTSKFSGKSFRGFKFVIDTMRHMILVQYSELFDATKGSDLLIAAGMQFMGKTVADTLEIPCAHVFHVPQVLESRHHPPVFMPFQNLPHLVNLLSWKIFKLIFRVTVCRIINNKRISLGLKCIENPHLFGNNRMIIAMDKELGPVPGDVRTSFLQTGYWNLSGEDELSDKSSTFIKAGSVPIYIGFGSMTDPNPATSARIISEALNILKVRAVIFKGWANLCNDLKSDNVCLVDSEPHEKLFPKMRAIIHHGGAGTSWTAAVSGVPQVLIPHATDQYYWANRFYRLGLSPHPVRRFKLTGAKLASTIDKAINDISIKESCAGMQNRIRQHDGLKEFMDRFENFCFSKG